MKKAKKIQLFLFLFVIVLGISLSYSDELSKVYSSSSSSYLGTANCASCHAEEYSSWNQTAHANMAGIAEINASGTFYWVAYPSRVMNQSDFIDSCASCHVTGWDPATETWPNWNSTDANLAGKFLNVQCEVCHGADTMSLPVEQRIDYSAELCAQCHSTGSHTQYEDWQNSAHNDSLTDLRASDHATDSCVRCHSTQIFVDYYNFSTYVEDVIGEITLTNPNLDPITCQLCHNPHSAENEYQLRFENSTEVCGQCHQGSHHPQYELFSDSPHEEAGVECVSCHGQGTHYAHGGVSSYFNHTFAIFNTFYPYNQTEPMVCGTCHTGESFEWAVSQLELIQNSTVDLLITVTQLIDEANVTITTANQTSGVDITKIEEAQTLFEAALNYAMYVENDGSGGFHNPDALTEAAQLATQAKTLATSAIATANLETQISTLEGDVENLEERINSLESTVATVPYLYAGLGLAIGFIVGAAILYAVVWRRKP